ncbi:Protein of unknown function [Paenibacillus sophorae]|uniref:DUF3048 domain-containing protein n=1 Tax=Paenibacillus sophorae TaxID=1333845 RepID=A0A1H8RY92_9BACL|nr:DUF3048 domain-containing protein [Paenibacillus sophorae]QWU16922.1 DUF3048 domain-containing protein [Paenibacillus sophorae]SEO71322.1 Protein of unknown function [Paenibacillus sophorae]
MMFNRSSSRLAAGILLASLVLSACGPQTAEPTGVSSAAPLSSAVPAPATPVPAPSPALSPVSVSGLTGLPVTEAPLPRPLAVMINNAPAARPQSGLTKADLLYEVLAEGGITRLIAIYQSQSGISKIGPVRSIRPYLIDIGESYGGVTVHAGGSPAAYAILQRQHKEDMDEIGRAGAYFWRDKSRKAPHNLYTSEDKLRTGAEKFGYGGAVAVQGYLFTNPDYVPVGGEPASGFKVHFLLQSYTVDYKYDSASRTYARWVNGKPHLDQDSGEPVEAANVIVMGADHTVLDEVGRLSVNLELGGEAMLFQRGEATRGRWVRKAGDVIRFVRDGKEAALYPGVTHFLIVPNTPSFESHLTVTSS